MLNEIVVFALWRECNIASFPIFKPQVVFAVVVDHIVPRMAIQLFYLLRSKRILRVPRITIGVALGKVRVDAVRWWVCERICGTSEATVYTAESLILQHKRNVADVELLLTSLCGPTASIPQTGKHRHGSDKGKRHVRLVVVDTYYLVINVPSASTITSYWLHSDMLVGFENSCWFWQSRHLHDDVFVPEEGILVEIRRRIELQVVTYFATSFAVQIKICLKSDWLSSDVTKKFKVHLIVSVLGLSIFIHVGMILRGRKLSKT